jgi:hypothetical protein
MRMKIKFLTTAIAVGVLGAASVMAADGVVDRATVGGFAGQLAWALGADSATFKLAKASLRAQGVKGDLDASAPLTAGIAARVAADLGIKVAAPSDPASPVSARQAATLAGYIGLMSLGAESTSVEPPNQCLSSENRGSCVDCCKEATGEKGQYCGRFCHANVSPPPSPDEPQP